MHKLKLFHIWKEAKDFIFQEMDKGTVSPERADEILEKIKGDVIELNPVDSDSLSQFFPELKNLTLRLKMEELEHVEKKNTSLFLHFVESGDFQKAEMFLTQK